MDERISKLLIKTVEDNFVIFMDKMDPVQILPYLKSYLSDTTDQIISRTSAAESDRTGNRKLWQALKRVPGWWEPFIYALNECGYTGLSTILQSKLDEIKSAQKHDRHEEVESQANSDDYRRTKQHDSLPNPRGSSPVVHPSTPPPDYQLYENQQHTITARSSKPSLDGFSSSPAIADQIEEMKKIKSQHSDLSNSGSVDKHRNIKNCQHALLMETHSTTNNVNGSKNLNQGFCVNQLKGLDVNQLNEGLDVNQLNEELDVNQLNEGLDVNQLNEGLDVNQLNEGLDVNQLNEGLDVNQLNKGLDVNQLNQGLDVNQLNQGFGENHLKGFGGEERQPTKNDTEIQTTLTANAPNVEIGNRNITSKTDEAASKETLTMPQSGNIPVLSLLLASVRQDSSKPTGNETQNTDIPASELSSAPSDVQPDYQSDEASIFKVNTEGSLELKSISFCNKLLKLDDHASYDQINTSHTQDNELCHSYHNSNSYMPELGSLNIQTAFEKSKCDGGPQTTTTQTDDCSVVLLHGRESNHAQLGEAAWPIKHHHATGISEVREQMDGPVIHKISKLQLVLSSPVTKTVTENLLSFF